MIDASERVCIHALGKKRQWEMKGENRRQNGCLLLDLSVYGKYRFEGGLRIGYAEIDVGQFLLYDIRTRS
ncbi:hypothetical protein B1A99_18400 [Cohnella sp. CIP 111063]|nr:hypothetical protein B1A99_18400 [Cohnella sp. CIP 111063]